MRGARGTLPKLTPLVYNELRRLAHRYVSAEPYPQSLQTTALINETYVRLVDAHIPNFQDRAHFFGVCAHLMRQILVDFARARHAEKRGAATIRLSLEEASEVSGESHTDLLELDDALNRLAEVDPRKSRVVEMRFFGGLSAEETAEVLSVSTKTVLRDWQLAKAWLLRELKADSSYGL
jgi:RNA polymerase sigma factor (TIGR02999 family)